MHFVLLGLFFAWQAPPKTKKVAKQPAKAEEKKKEEPEVEKEEVSAENGEAKAEKVLEACLCEICTVAVFKENQNSKACFLHPSGGCSSR